MYYRLVNEKDPTIRLGISRGAWNGLLNMAEEHGWNAMGTVMPGGWVEAGLTPGGWGAPSVDRYYGCYIRGDERLVILDDSLNLADALERAFLSHEPRFGSWVNQLYRADSNDYSWPGIGTLLAIIDFCRQGAFVIEIP